MSIRRRQSVQNCSQLGYFLPGNLELRQAHNASRLPTWSPSARAVRACGHCGRETEVNVDAWSSSHPMHPNRNANRYHQKQRQRHRKINRIRIHLSTSLPVAGTKLT
jgi:hypothetical protein